MLDIYQSKQPFSQLQVEQTTGLSREVLRKWELRYGFPLPQRGARGQRLYSAATVRQLIWLKQLIRQGLRPGSLLTLPPEMWQTMAESADACAADSADRVTWVTRVLDDLAPEASLPSLRSTLLELIGQKGLGPFVSNYFPELNTAVGDAWAQGKLAVYAEHRYSETVRELLATAASKLVTEPKLGRALLTTPPAEQHGLGLLGLQVALALKGVECVVLGTQTPAQEVISAARTMAVHVVAISASEGYAAKDLQNYLCSLRAGLPDTCALWVGGQGSRRISNHPLNGVHVFESIFSAVSAWPVR